MMDLGFGPQSSLKDVLYIAGGATTQRVRILKTNSSIEKAGVLGVVHVLRNVLTRPFH